MKPPVRMLRSAAAALLWLVMGLGCAAMLAFGALRVTGYETFTVLSGSMEPVISTGDLVVDERIAAADAQVGDVITFPEPQSDRLITHRLEHKRRVGGWLHMRTRGDANNTPERWNIRADGEIGRVAFHVPYGGYVAAFVKNRDLQLLLVVIPAALLGVLELVHIWKPRRREPHGRARPV